LEAVILVKKVIAQLHEVVVHRRRRGTGDDVDSRSWCARTDGEQYAGEDVTVLNEQSGKDAPKNLIAPLSRARSSTGISSEGTYSRRRCARSTGDVNAGKQQRE
jgi:hypothetical protein